MQFLYMGLFAAGIVAADQFTKFLTVANIGLHQDVPFIPGFLGLTYIQNTGAAFSSFEGQQWLFALIFLIFTALAAVLIILDKIFFVISIGLIVVGAILAIIIMFLIYGTGHIISQNNEILKKL